MPSGDQNYPRREAQYRELPAASHDDAHNGDPRLLDAVIHETEKLLEKASGQKPPQDDAEAADVAAVRAIAQRRRGEPFTLEPVVREIASALLEKTFRRYLATTEEWNALVTELAHTLYDDPDAHDRLRRMWERMSGSGAV